MKLSDINIKSVVDAAHTDWERSQRSQASSLDHKILVYLPFLVMGGYTALSIFHTITMLKFFVPSVGALAGVFSIEAVLFYSAYYHVRFGRSARHIFVLEWAAALSSFVMNLLGNLDQLALNEARIAQIGKGIPVAFVADNVDYMFMLVAFFLAVIVPVGQWGAGFGVARHIVSERDKKKDDSGWEAVKVERTYRALLEAALRANRNVEVASAWARRVVDAYYGVDSSGRQKTDIDSPRLQSGAEKIELRPVQEVQNVQYTEAVQSLDDGGLTTQGLAQIIVHNPQLLNMHHKELGKMSGLSRASVFNAKREARDELERLSKGSPQNAEPGRGNHRGPIEVKPTTSLGGAPDRN